MSYQKETNFIVQAIEDITRLNAALSINQAR